MAGKIRVAGLVLAGALLLPALAAAQAPPHPKSRIIPEKQLSGPQDCIRTPATTGEGAGAAAPEGRTLSQQLARSNGVICPPPHTDPEMKKPAPGGGTMPVIPPPGSPGGPRGAEPK